MLSLQTCTEYYGYNKPTTIICQGIAKPAEETPKLTTSFFFRAHVLEEERIATKVDYRFRVNSKYLKRTLLPMDAVESKPGEH